MRSLELIRKQKEQDASLEEIKSEIDEAKDGYATLKEKLDNFQPAGSGGNGSPISILDRVEELVTSKIRVSVGIESYDPIRDMLQVYLNGIRLIEGTDYNLNTSTSEIENIGGEWTSGSHMLFEVIKNIIITDNSDIKTYTDSTEIPGIDAASTIEDLINALPSGSIFAGNINGSKMTTIKSQCPYGYGVLIITKVMLARTKVEFITSNNGSTTQGNATYTCNYNETVNKISEWSKVVTYSDLGNNNLLANGDFQVWQRGDNFTLASERKYTADRWIVLSDGNVTVQKSDNGMILSLTNTGWANLAQLIDAEFAQKLKGKTLTLTIKTKEKNNNISQAWFYMRNNSNPYRQIIFDSTERDVFAHTFTVPADEDFEVCEVGIQLYKGSIEIEYMKLEISTISTPLIPRSYEEELSSCQRYFYRLYGTTGSGAVGTIDTNGSWSSGFLFPTTMRTIPTCKVTVASSMDGTVITDYVKPHRFDIHGCGLFDVRTYVDRSPGDLIRITEFEADAEIY